MSRPKIIIKSAVIVLAILFWMALSWCQKHPVWVETYYSEGLYPILAKLNHHITALFSISLGDILYTIMLVLALKTLFRISLWFKWNTWLNLASWLGFIYIIFHLLWGLNYHRQPLASKLNLKGQYSDVDLENTTDFFVALSNKTHQKLTSNDTLAIVFNQTNKTLFALAQEAVLGLFPTQTDFAYRTASVKKSLFSRPLSYMGYSGYLNPFTNEAHINKLMPKFRFPTTLCHEMAHQLGYAAEQEANFLGIVACIESNDLHFQYSGATLAMQYLLGELRQRNPDCYRKKLAKVNPGILKNIGQVQNFWEDYQNPLEPLFKKSFDTYLKANHQTAGIQSYNLVVDLLLAHHKQTQ